MRRNTWILIIAGGLALAAIIGFWIASAGKQSKASQAQAQKPAIAYWVDPMNPANTFDRPGKAPCGMDLVPVYVNEAGAKGVRIDPSVVQNIGVTSQKVETRNLTKEIRTSGTVQFNEPKLFTISTKIMGWAVKLYVNYTGEQVAKGQPLLEIYSPELVSTQDEYLQALRYAASLPAGASEEARRGARELAQSARARLRNWDIPESGIDALEKRGTASKTMPLRAPESGVVLEKMVIQGQQVEPGMPLYRIADLSTVWIMADIYQQDLPFVKIGQNAEITLSYWPGKLYEGRVTFLSPVVSQDAKTAQARIEVRNTPDYQVKPGMFATVRIASPVAVEALAIPEQAVIRSGERNIAVIEKGNGYFEPREVHLGVTAGGYVQVLHGLEAGEKVVTSAQFLIDSESNLKSAVQRLGAGHQHGQAAPEDGGEVEGENAGPAEPAPQAPAAGGHSGH